MLRERITNTTKDLLDIMPDKFYFDTLRPHMIDMLANVKFDPIMTETLEKTINKADSCAGRQDYPELSEAFGVLSGVLLSPKSTYQQSDSFIRAKEAEKEAVRTLAKHLQDILTIIQCTPKENKEVVNATKERLGYDSDKGENIVFANADAEIKERIPTV